MTDFFKDKEYQKFYEQNGFIKVNLLNEEEIGALWAIYSTLPSPKTDTGFYTSIYNQQVGQRYKASVAISEIIWRKANLIFNDCRCVLGSFLSKEKGESGIIQMHQDWTFVDESNGNRSFHVWCPLVATNHTNGNLYVLPRSHLLPILPRVAPSSYFPYSDAKCMDFIQKKSIALPTKLGEAIIYDNSLIHFSSQNFTDQPRVAAGVLVIPNQVQLVFLSGTQNSFEFCKYIVDDNFYLDYDFINNPKDNCKVDEGTYRSLQDPLNILEVHG